MPQRTKPKTPPTAWMFPVTLDAQDRREAIGLLGFDEAPSDEQDGMIETLEFDLMHHFNLLARLPARPLPAHTKAELEAMITPAQKLLEKIAPNRLTTEARKCLRDVDTGHLWYQLTYLITDAKLAIDMLTKSSRKSDGGALNQRDKEVRKSIETALVSFFDKNSRLENSKEYRADFVEFCMSKMPAPPSRQSKKVKPKK